MEAQREGEVVLEKRRQRQLDAPSIKSFIDRDGSHQIGLCQ